MQVFNPPLSILQEEVLKGLKQYPKQLHPKWFYDDKGSQLFNQITTLPEYYLTRAEKEILTTYHSEITSLIQPNASLIELGCGNEEKIKLLLSSLRWGNRYVPVDISQKALNETVTKLRLSFPLLDIIPIQADYTQAFSFLGNNLVEPKIVLFLGSTIGNFEERDREVFLKKLAKYLNPQDGLLIGIDLIKSTKVVEDAYNDSQGITAAFNKNMLHHLNRELQTNFQVEHFKHHAFYNHKQNRIEMHLVNMKLHNVTIGNETISILPDETIHTENSYKFDFDEFEQMLHKVGLCMRKIWMDQQRNFALTYIKKI
ncbi:L-histidine N(alpha)-methyltransferase [Bacillus carboniphilus]|uniref:4-dimethylallyltryptophan N-methyltransferase n=1 Tax=Bacillus carboniphilus TaxID=86663 RepID=A0ABY9JYB0_9BACI|nr:L-histidine N(alpha)-methyltransferase [Bacillus carboniphilus]WLR44381.1 L-histidine N(alpha)-methyltransferase [Bacillus carboniphilus]